MSNKPKREFKIKNPDIENDDPYEILTKQNEMLMNLVKMQTDQIGHLSQQMSNFELKMEHLIKQNKTTEYPSSPRVIPSSPRYTSKNLKSSEVIENILNETENFKEDVTKFADSVYQVMEAKNKKELYYRKVFTELTNNINNNSANVKFVNFYDLLNKNTSVFNQIPKHILALFRSIGDKDEFYYIEKGENMFSSNITVYIYSP